MAVHQGEESAHSLLAEGCSNRLTDGGVWRFEDVSAPRFVGTEGRVDTGRLKKMGIRRMADVVEKRGQLHEFLVVFGQQSGMNFVQMKGKTTSEVVRAQ